MVSNLKKYLDKYSNDEKYDLFLNATNNSKAVCKNFINNVEKCVNSI